MEKIGLVVGGSNGMDLSISQKLKTRGEIIYFPYTQCTSSTQLRNVITRLKYE